MNRHQALGSAVALLMIILMVITGLRFLVSAIEQETRTDERQKIKQRIINQRTPEGDQLVSEVAEALYREANRRAVAELGGR